MGTTGKGTVSRSRKQKQALRDLGTPPKSAQKLSKSARAVTEQAASLDRLMVVLCRAGDRLAARERAVLVGRAACFVRLYANSMENADERWEHAHRLADELVRLERALAREGGAP